MGQCIGVFCGSSTRAESRYLDVATKLGHELGQRGPTLVYGAGSIGLMGAVARAVHDVGGKVVGVIPHAMDHKEVTYRQCDELIFTDTMRERKDIMDQRSDAFITLPGGFGTLEELIEILTHRHLRFHNKPIVIVNTDGFYDPLLELFDHFIAHNFAKKKHLDDFRVVTHVEEVFTGELDERS